MNQEEIFNLFSKIVFETKDSNFGSKLSWEEFLSSQEEESSQYEIVTAYKNALIAVLMLAYIRVENSWFQIIENNDLLTELTEVFFEKKAEVYGYPPGGWKILSQNHDIAVNAYVLGIKKLFQKCAEINLNYEELFSVGGWNENKSSNRAFG